MSELLTFHVERYVARVDHFLCRKFPHISRSAIHRWLLNGLVTLNGAPLSKKSQELWPDDIVAVRQEYVQPDVYLPSQKLHKVYEDDQLLIINKPEGISVHPSPAEKGEETILHIFRYHYPVIDEMTDKDRPGIVHRLDKDTSGLLILAKDESTMVRMKKKFKHREIEKTYMALVNGHMRFRNGTMEWPIAPSLKNPTRFEVVRSKGGREDQREAYTAYSVVYEFEFFSLLKLFPRTGRTHQLRVHLLAEGNAIMGDRLYADPKAPFFPRLALHAYALRFRHPVSDVIVEAYCPLPHPWRRFMAEHIRRGHNETGKTR